MHAAAAPAELMLYEELGLCGEGPGLLASGATQLGGWIRSTPAAVYSAKAIPSGLREADSSSSSCAAEPEDGKYRERGWRSRRTEVVSWAKMPLRRRYTFWQGEKAVIDQQGYGTRNVIGTTMRTQGRQKAD